MSCFRKILYTLAFATSTGYACHYCDAVHNGKMITEEDQKIYVETGEIFVQDGHLICLHGKKCYFISCVFSDDQGVFFWTDQIIDEYEARTE